ncbi:MAG: ParB N-terminal domain-containing protein [Candidatus Omnitrophica bacterium]|nr:ParB N-terminal domain-containing protein [Candidatus Omnitrophota bacterium]
MEKYVFKNLKLDQMRDDFPFRCRYRLADLALENSIAKRGVTHPLFVTGDARPVVLSGHRRYQAAQKAQIHKIPVFQIQEPLGPSDCFVFSVLSNWNQNWPDLDRAWTLHQAKEKFHLPERDLMELVLPALGLAAEGHILEQYESVACLDPSLLDWVAEDKLPFRGVQVLARFSGEDQKAFASLIVGEAALTTNQLLKVGQWLYDLLKKERLTLADFFAKYDLGRVLNRGEGDRRQKAERFYALLRHLRFPRLVEYEKKFHALSKSLEENSRELKLEAPESFEAQGFTLHARIANGQALKKVLAILEKEKPSLNSLFDLML